MTFCFYYCSIVVVKFLLQQRRRKLIRRYRESVERRRISRGEPNLLCPDIRSMDDETHQHSIGMAASDFIRYILITGPPGVGKTTLVRRVCDLVKQEFQTSNDFTLSGFYTEEVRDPKSGQRIGFDIVDISSDRRAPLAASSVEIPTNAPRVGKYGVVLDRFEPLALDCLAVDKETGGDQKSKYRLLVIDEIGKMESFSKPFCAQVERLFDKNRYPNLAILATVPMDKGQRLPDIVHKVKNAGGNRLVMVSRENRDRLVEEVKDMVNKAMEDMKRG